MRIAALLLAFTMAGCAAAPKPLPPCPPIPKAGPLTSRAQYTQDLIVLYAECAKGRNNVVSEP